MEKPKEARVQRPQGTQPKVFHETHETEEYPKFPAGIKLKDYDSRLVITDNLTDAEAESLYMK